MNAPDQFDSARRAAIPLVQSRRRFLYGASAALATAAVGRPPVASANGLQALNLRQILDAIDLASELLSDGAAVAQTIGALWNALPIHGQQQLNTASNTGSQGNYNGDQNATTYRSTHQPPAWLTGTQSFTPTYYFPLIRSDSSNLRMVFYNPSLWQFYDDPSLPYNYSNNVGVSSLDYPSLAIPMIDMQSMLTLIAAAQQIGRNAAHANLIPLVTYSDPNVFSELFVNYFRPKMYLTATGIMSIDYVANPSAGQGSAQGWTFLSLVTYSGATIWNRQQYSIYA